MRGRALGREDWGGGRSSGQEEEKLVEDLNGKSVSVLVEADLINVETQTQEQTV